MPSETLIECPVLRSANEPLGRMDIGEHAQFRRLMLYPTELRAAAYSLRLLLSFCLFASTAPKVQKAVLYFKTS